MDRGTIASLDPLEGRGHPFTPTRVPALETAKASGLGCA